MPEPVSQAALEYLLNEGLGQFIDFGSKASSQFAPEPEDLARIHRLIRIRKSLTVLELGVGYSTIVIAHALRKNEQEFNALSPAPELRNRFLFRCFTVDASTHWLKLAEERFPTELRPYVAFCQSMVRIGTHNGQLCHFYERLPDVVPDFVYLDGPDPKDVQGSINGMSFQCDERTVMAADPLLMESTMLPGFFMLVDGRSNNCRFLERNLTRKFKITWDRSGDVTTFELDEERLGQVNILGSDVIPPS
jgi:hypothetical protein